MNTITPTALRENVYDILDTVIKTGIPRLIKRKGHILTITIPPKINKLDKLTPHNAILGDPDELIHLRTGKWSEVKKI